MVAKTRSVNYNVEEIKHQTWGDDELNKGAEEIHRAPRRYIPVPKVKKNNKTVKQNGKSDEKELPQDS